MTKHMLCTEVILLLLFLIENTSPESPRCERRLVCGSDGQVYETSCDFERALRRDQDLGARPLHECLGILYVLMPKEHSRAFKNLIKQKIARFVGPTSEIRKAHGIKSQKSNAVSKVLGDILSLQGADDTANLMTLCPRGRGCPDTIYILPEKHFIPQKNFKSVVLPTRKLFSLLEWIPGYQIVSTITGGVTNKIENYFKGLMQRVLNYIILKAQELVIYLIKSYILGPLEKNYNDKIDNNNGETNKNYDKYNDHYAVDTNHPNFDYTRYLNNNYYNNYHHYHHYLK